MPLFSNNRIKNNGKMLDSLDYSDILAPDTTIQDLLVVCDSSDYSTSFKTKQYTYYQGGDYNSTQGKKWKQIFKALMIHFPTLLYLTCSQYQTRLLSSTVNINWRIFNQNISNNFYLIGISEEKAQWYY